MSTMVILSAIDCLLLRSALELSAAADALLLLCLLPMGNVLAIATFHLFASRGKRGHFLPGFVTAGVFAVFVFAGLWTSSPLWIAEPMVKLDEHFYDGFLLGGNIQLRHYAFRLSGPITYVRFAAYLALVTAMPTSLLLNAALAGGYTWGRIARGRGSVPSAGGAFAGSSSVAAESLLAPGTPRD